MRHLRFIFIWIVGGFACLGLLYGFLWKKIGYSPAMENLYINGERACFDAANGIYLYPLSKEEFQKDSLMLNFHFCNHDTVVIITPPMLEGNKSIKLSNKKWRCGEFCVEFTSLPIVELTYTKLGYVEHTPAQIRVKTDSCDFQSLCTQRYRGNTSKWKNLEKKAYSVKLIDDENRKRKVSLLGMREDDAWILDPMSCDYSRMRNLVSFDLWKDMDEQNIGIDGRFVELFVNHEYKGVYCLTEKVDRKQLGLKKARNGYLRGALYKCRSNQFPSSFFISDEADNSLGAWRVKYPKKLVAGIDSMAPLKETMLFLNTGSAEEFKRRSDSLLNVPMIIDNYLLIELLSAYDNIGCNKYVYYTNYGKNNKMSMLPWDMDRTWTKLTADELALYEERMEKNLLYTRLRRDYPDFDKRLSNRWNELRDGVFQEEALQNRFEEYLSLLQYAGAARREEAVWTREAYVDYLPEQSLFDKLLFRKPHARKKYSLKGGSPFSMKVEVDEIKEYIHLRLEELDTKYGKHFGCKTT